MYKKYYACIKKKFLVQKFQKLYNGHSLKKFKTKCNNLIIIRFVRAYL